MNQKNLAEKLNVSVSTISKALSDSTEISDNIKNKIIDLAFETGYFSEVHKRKRDYNNNVIIAIICPEIISPYYASIVNKLRNEIKNHGGKVAVYIDDFSEKISNDIVKTLTIRNQTDGIITLSSKINIKTGIPILNFNTSKDIKNKDYFGCDTKKVIFDAIKYLKEKGHTEIGFIGETKTMQKFANFKDALFENNLNYKENYTIISDKRFEENGFYAGDVFLERKEKPTAFICAYDEIALGFIHKVSSKGIKVPEDISVMGINDITYSSYSKIPLTTINVLDESIYKKAVDTIYDKITHKDKNVHHITVNHTIIKRNTVFDLSGGKNG